MRELRVHARVETTVAGLLMTDSGTIDIVIEDLSPGGARIRAPEGVALVGDVVTLEISVPGQETGISVMAEVVRSAPAGEHQLFGLRFSLVEPKQQDALATFLQSLASGVGSGSRKHARVHRRVSVVCKTDGEVRAMMSNVSQGGIALHTPTALVIGEEVTVEILTHIDNGKTIWLPGTVSHVRTVAAGEFEVGVRFDELTLALQDSLSEFIKSML